MSYQAYSATVIGSLHTVRGVPCEDASGVFELPRSAGFIIAVADGHGDQACSRSAIGSGFAVVSASRILQTIASDMAPLLNGASQADDIEASRVLELPWIKERLVSEWRQMCEAHLEKNPPSDKELAGLNSGGRRHSPLYLYGTTLVCMAQMGDCLIALQQGDGCCALMDAQGEWWQPVSPDDSCVGNVTASMSDANASDGMRHAIVDLRERQVVACLAVTDGVEKSFSSDRALYSSLGELILDVAGSTRANAARSLESSLSRMSGEASGDDSSVGIIVDDNLPGHLLRLLDMRVRDERMHQALHELRAKIVSMERKHAHLERLWEAGQCDAASEYPSYHERYVALNEELAELEANASVLGEEQASLPQLLQDDRDEPSALHGKTSVPDLYVDKASRPIERVARNRYIVVIVALICGALLVGSACFWIVRPALSRMGEQSEGKEETFAEIPTAEASSNKDAEQLRQEMVLRHQLPSAKPPYSPQEYGDSDLENETNPLYEGEYDDAAEYESPLITE